MGRIILQMHISVDGMVSGPKGELDWIASDESLLRVRLAALEQADVAVLGAGAYAEMSSYWTAAEHDKKAEAVIRNIGRVINAIPKVVYGRKDMPVDWRNTTVRVVDDDNAFLNDVHRLKRDTAGNILVYGGVRLARSFVQHDLVDEIQLDVSPIILGEGQPLFFDLTDRKSLRLRQTITYDSGATNMQYEVVKAADS